MHTIPLGPLFGYVYQLQHRLGQVALPIVHCDTWVAHFALWLRCRQLVKGKRTQPKSCSFLPHGNFTGHEKGTYRELVTAIAMLLHSATWFITQEE